MSKKSQEYKNWLETRICLAGQFNAALAERRMSIIGVADQTGIPLYVVENISLGRNINNLQDLRRAAAFLNKRLKIELTNYT